MAHNLNNLSWKSIYSFIIFITIISIIFLYLPVSGNLGTPYSQFSNGINQVTFNQSIGLITASNLVALNPTIQVISFYDSFADSDVSYLNVFGGIGTNFIIYPGINYSIYVPENITFYVP